MDCQAPKPILLDTGEMKQPYDWAVSYSPANIFFLVLWTLSYLQVTTLFSKSFMRSNYLVDLFLNTTMNLLVSSWYMPEITNKKCS